MSEQKKFLTLTGKALNIKSWNKDTRVNVKSNRANTKIQEDHNSYDITKKGPFIWATDDEYTKFAEINEIKDEPYKRVQYSDMVSSDDEDTPQKVKNKIKPIVKYSSTDEDEEEKVKSSISKKNKVISKAKDKVESSSSDEEDEIKSPVVRKNKEDKVELDVPVICKKDVAGTILHTPDHTDPSKLSEAALEALCPFQVSGLRGWAVVTDVTDGDTLDIVIYVPLNELALGHTYKRYTKTGLRSFIHTENVSAGFFAKFRCRLLNCDSMEKNNPEGKFAKEVTKLFYKSISSRVWYEFVSDTNIEQKDKYGRTLVTLYADDTKKVNYNEFLFQFNTSDIIVVEKYNGGTKSEHSKALASRDNIKTAKIKKRLDLKLEEYKATLT